MAKTNILTFKSSADILFSAGDFTSATILYFKTLFAIEDFILLEKIGQSPKDHNERFRMLQKYFPESYTILDKEFSTYRDTYTKILDKPTCSRIRSLVEDEIKRHSV
ncbi:hypothetical protein JW968_01715 [Candidatus Woesearchaeota archaeon]|nr:hypothetical protein [Candidatus Woesearchaeota archaeon]